MNEFTRLSDLVPIVNATNRIAEAETDIKNINFEVKFIEHSNSRKNYNSMILIWNALSTPKEEIIARLKRSHAGFDEALMKARLQSTLLRESKSIWLASTDTANYIIRESRLENKRINKLSLIRVLNKKNECETIIGELTDNVLAELSIDLISKIVLSIELLERATNSTPRHRVPLEPKK